MLRKGLLFFIAVAVFFMNAVCFCVVSNAMSSRHTAALSAAPNACCKCVNTGEGTSKKSPADGCGDPRCPHCPGTTPMLTAAHAVVPIDVAPLACGFSPQGLLPVVTEPASNAVARSDLAQAWTDPPTLLDLACCLVI